MIKKKIKFLSWNLIQIIEFNQSVSQRCVLHVIILKVFILWHLSNLLKRVLKGAYFDESLCFHPHFENLWARALSRLNIIKIFSHKSWHLSKKTLTCIYRALIGSIFDYSFFTVACVSDIVALVLSNDSKTELSGVSTY